MLSTIVTDETKFMHDLTLSPVVLSLLSIVEVVDHIAGIGEVDLFGVEIGFLDAICTLVDKNEGVGAVDVVGMI